MRATTLLACLLGIKGTVVTGFRADGDSLVIDVKPSWARPRCAGCGHKGRSAYDERHDRRWRHLDFGGTQVELSYNLRRINCSHCGVVVERVPWADDPASRFTVDFENQVAFLAQRTDMTSISGMMRIAWRSVGRVIQRVVGRTLPSAEGPLRIIGVDELSYRKHHQYVTLVTDHDTRRIVWGKEGKNAETLAAFFDGLGPEKCAGIEVVTMDMSGAFISAVRLKVPKAQIVFDRFHVQQLASKAVDSTRREIWRGVKGTDAGDAIKNMRWLLLRSQDSLKKGELQRIKDLEKSNANLYRAYLLKESLGKLLDGAEVATIKANLRNWIADAKTSGLAAFEKTAGTFETHFDGIVAYADRRLTNGLIEGLNNKARLITRRAYGFHSAKAALAMIQLCCGGIELSAIHRAFERPA